MKCIQINIRKATFLLLSMLINISQHSQIDENVTNIGTEEIKFSCSNENTCRLPTPECYNCTLNEACIYGEEKTVTCDILPNLNCHGEATITKSYICRYCYQTEIWEHTCDFKANCNSIATSRTPYHTNCTVHKNILCLGSRTFNKNILCNWTGGYRWSTALALSITLGGFGADRFYLGHWQEGIGKLFSFGGLGVWTLIDVILISLHYLGPADGSLYI